MPKGSKQAIRVQNMSKGSNQVIRVQNISEVQNQAQGFKIVHILQIITSS